MRLDYSINRFDLFRAQGRAVLANRILWLIFGPVLAFVWWSTFNWPESRLQTTPVRIVAATFTALTCAAVGAAGSCAFLALSALLRRDKGVLGPHSLELTDEGLVESTEVNRSLFKWGSSFRVRETARYVYIYISETNFHLVPRSSLAPPGALDHFLLQLRAKLNPVQPLPSPSAVSPSPPP